MKAPGGSVSDKTLFSVGWRVDELSRLNEAGRSMLVEVRCLMEILTKEDEDLVAANAAKRLCTLSKTATTFLKGKYIYFIRKHNSDNFHVVT